MFSMVAMTVVTVGWDYQGAAEPPRRHRHLRVRLAIPQPTEW